MKSNSEKELKEIKRKPVDGTHIKRKKFKKKKKTA